MHVDDVIFELLEQACSDLCSWICASLRSAHDIASSWSLWALWYWHEYGTVLGLVKNSMTHYDEASGHCNRVGLANNFCNDFLLDV